MAAVISDEAVRCSAWTRAHGLDPIGSIGSYAGWVVVDQPLPWPPDAGALAGLAGISGRAAAGNLRLQATVPTPGAPDAATLYVRPDGAWFAGYAGRATLLGTDPAAALSELLAARPAPTDTGADGDSGVGSHVLVCTHGRRDTCCGSLGTALAMSLLAAPPDADFRGRPVRLQRTSHTGGHRFAPTFVVLPEGTSWAYADAALVDAVVSRSGPIEEVVDRYRGCSGLGSPAQQALEREVLRQVGWDLLDRPRRGVDLGDGRTQLHVRQPDGSVEVWEGTVTTGRVIPLPECGEPPAGAYKTASELDVVGGHRISTS